MDMAIDTIKKALQVCQTDVFVSWAGKYIDGSDRSLESAHKCHEALEAEWRLSTANSQVAIAAASYIAGAMARSDATQRDLEIAMSRLRADQAMASIKLAA